MNDLYFIESDLIPINIVGVNIIYFKFMKELGKHYALQKSLFSNFKFTHGVTTAIKFAFFYNIFCYKPYCFVDKKNTS